MAVVSPWCYAVSAFFNASYGHLPFQKHSGEFTPRWVDLHVGSRLVIMALIYWDTPVLQWNAQIVAKEARIACS